MSYRLKQKANQNKIAPILNRNNKIHTTQFAINEQFKQFQSKLYSTNSMTDADAFKVFFKKNGPYHSFLTQRKKPFVLH